MTKIFTTGARAAAAVCRGGGGGEVEGGEGGGGGEGAPQGGRILGSLFSEASCSGGRAGEGE